MESDLLSYHRSQYTGELDYHRTGSARPQLDKWQKKKEPHEQVAVGETVKRSKRKMRAKVDGLERRVEGR